MPTAMDETQYIQICHDAADICYSDVDSYGPQRALNAARQLSPGDRVIVSTTSGRFSATLESVHDSLSAVREGDLLRLVATSRITPAAAETPQAASAPAAGKVAHLASFRRGSDDYCG